MTQEIDNWNEIEEALFEGFDIIKIVFLYVEQRLSEFHTLFENKIGTKTSSFLSSSGDRNRKFSDGDFFWDLESSRGVGKIKIRVGLHLGKNTYLPISMRKPFVSWQLVGIREYSDMRATLYELEEYPVSIDGKINDDWEIYPESITAIPLQENGHFYYYGTPDMRCCILYHALDVLSGANKDEIFLWLLNIQESMQKERFIKSNYGVKLFEVLNA